MLKTVASKNLHDDQAVHKKHAVSGDTVLPGHALSPEAILTAQLRREANEEKDAFGWHAFQALSISSLALGGILLFMFSPQGFPAVGLAAWPILVFALVTCRLGDSCYSSANRHNGFELFLYRVRTIPGDSEGRWKREYRGIEWEAAMRAWRVVQATLFEAIYEPGNYLTSDKLRSKFNTKKNPFWFCQSSISRESGAKFHAGTYLERMHAMLLLVAAASVAILFATVLALPFKPFELDIASTHVHAPASDPRPPAAGRNSTSIPARSGPGVPADEPTVVLAWLDRNLPPLVSKNLLTQDFLNVVVFFLCLAAAFVGLGFLYMRYRAEKSKRKIMEDGLLSIHSCSITWQAVVVAHFSAAARARDCGLASWKLVELSRKARARHRREWKQWKSGALAFEKVLERMTDEDKGDRDIGAGISGYTFWLSEEAASLARCAAEVPGWIGVGEEGLRKRGLVKSP